MGLGHEGFILIRDISNLMKEAEWGCTFPSHHERLHNIERPCHQNLCSDVWFHWTHDFEQGISCVYEAASLCPLLLLCRHAVSSLPKSKVCSSTEMFILMFRPRSHLGSSHSVSNAEITTH